MTALHPPQLTKEQLKVLDTIAPKLFRDPEFAAAMVVDPRYNLLLTGLKEDDVTQIVSYIRYVGELAQKDKASDWI